MFNSDLQAEFLDRRFEGLKGYIAIAVRFNGKGWVEHQYLWPEQKAQLLSNVKDLESKKADIYICPVLRKDEGRDKWNGLGGRTVFADLDGGEIPIDLSPCVELVNSGTSGHYHAYITLTSVQPVERIEALNYALAKISNGDSKWANNTVLRLPGTTNFKNEPLSVTVNQLASVVVDANNLADFFGTNMPRFNIEYPTDAEVNGLREIHIPSDIHFYLQQRLDEDSSGDKSNKSYHFIVTCIEKGYPANLIYSLALQHAPTVVKYGMRKDGIKNQVLTVIKSKKQRDEKFVNSPMFQDARKWL